MSLQLGTKIVTLTSHANGDTYGDDARHFYRTIQALVEPNVISMALSTPPGSPSRDDTYVVAAGGTGAWTGHDNQIAYWAIDAQDGVVTAGAWEFYSPLAGWVVYDNNTASSWRWNGVKWLSSGRKVVVTETGGAATVDASQANSFRLAIDHLQGTMTVTIVNPQFDGQEIELLFVQDSTGGITVNLPASVKGSPTITTTASKVTTLRLTWDTANSAWYTVSNYPNQ